MKSFVFSLKTLVDQQTEHFSQNWIQTELVVLLSNLNVLLAPEPAAEIHL